MTTPRNHRLDIPPRGPRTHNIAMPQPQSMPAPLVRVRYKRNVLKPRQLFGVEGDVRELERHFAAQLIADGYAELWPISPLQPPASPPEATP